MLTENDLRELVGFTASAPVLSLYLNTDPSQGNADAHKLRARSLLKDIHLPQDVEAINRYLDMEYKMAGRGVAIFSSAPAGFFRAYPLGVPVRSAVHISDRPSVKILTELLDNYGGHGVALVDKQGARVFYFHLGRWSNKKASSAKPSSIPSTEDRLPCPVGAAGPPARLAPWMSRSTAT